jgi:hypothetical protein
MLRTGRMGRAAFNLGGTLAIGITLCGLGYALAH